MCRILAAAMAFLLDTIISTNIFLGYSADPELLAQHFFQFGITDVKGDFSAAERRYKIRGVYAIGEDSNYDGTFDLSKHKVQESFEWFAEGRFNPVTKATDEKLDLFNAASRKYAGSFTSTMMCNQDPWLEPYSSGRCQKTNPKPSANPIPPDSFDADLGSTAPDIPFSAALTTTERFRLNQQFVTFLAARQKIKPGSLPMDVSTAPVIVSPAQNGYMVWRKSEFIIQPNPKFGGDMMRVEFRWLNTGVTEVWPQPTAILSQGAPIPEGVLGPRPGPMTIRARIDSPKPSAYSREVRFEYLMQSPSLTPPSKTPIELQKR